MDVHPPKNGIFIGIDPYPFVTFCHVLSQGGTCPMVDTLWTYWGYPNTAFLTIENMMIQRMDWAFPNIFSHPKNCPAVKIFFCTDLGALWRSFSVRPRWYLRLYCLDSRFFHQGSGHVFGESPEGGVVNGTRMDTIQTSLFVRLAYWRQSMSAMSAFPDFPMGWLNLVGTITVESMFLTSKYRAKPYKFVLPILGYLWIFGLMLQAYLIPLVRINHCYIPSPIFFFRRLMPGQNHPLGDRKIVSGDCIRVVWRPSETALGKRQKTGGGAPRCERWCRKLPVFGVENPQ